MLFSSYLQCQVLIVIRIVISYVCRIHILHFVYFICIFFDFDFCKLYFVIGAVCAELTNTDIKAQSHYSVPHQRMLKQTKVVRMSSCSGGYFHTQCVRSSVSAPLEW